MSWHFLPELAAEYSEVICLDGDVYVQSNTTSTQGMCRSPDNETASCQSSQSGTMCEHSTQGHGEAWLTLYLADFRAKTSHPQERAQESKEHVQDSGKKWLGLSVKYDRDSHSWKTHQCLFQEDLPQSSVTSPKWGMMRSGVLYRLRTAEHPISEKEYGLSVGTPTASMRVRSDSFQEGRLPTPAEMAEQIRWPTPDANCGNRGTSKNPSAKTRPSGAQKQLSLNDAVKMWPTPTAGDSRGARNSTAIRKDSQSKHHEGTTLTDAAVPTGGKLNLMWVEWLMAWPIGWTDLDALGMDKFQSWQQQHGVS
jgi:hypothetical protein